MRTNTICATLGQLKPPPNDHFKPRIANILLILLNTSFQQIVNHMNALDLKLQQRYVFSSKVTYLCVEVTMINN